MCLWFYVYSQINDLTTDYNTHESSISAMKNDRQHLETTINRMYEASANLEQLVRSTGFDVEELQNSVNSLTETEEKNSVVIRNS